MAFDNETLSHVGGSSPAPRLYTYETSDDRNTVLAAGYFNAAFTKFQVRDIIIVNNTEEVYSVKVTAVAPNSVTVVKSSLSKHEHAYYYVPAQEDTAINNDGVTYTQVANMVGSYLHHFTVTSGQLVYDGVGGDFLFNGAIDASCDNVADITTAMFLNGSPTPQAIVTSYEHSNSRIQASSTGFLTLATGDTLDVRIKGDGVINATLSIFNMNLTFVEL